MKRRTYRKIRKNIIIAIISIIGYYYVFSSYFHNPVESQLIKTNIALKNELQELKQNIALYDSAYKNIENRDKNIYKRLFNVEPVSTRYDFKSFGATNKNKYNSLNTDELLKLYTTRSARLFSEITEGSKEISSLEKAMTKSGTKFQRIPSIQPIDNPMFDAPFVASGMKINPFYKATELHTGIDYAIEEGTRVIATADGIARFSRKISDKGGLSIEIDHTNDYRTRYSNLSKVIIRNNEFVTKGKIIGYSGNTGYSFMPHLHSEVLYKKEQVAPEDFFFADLSMLEYYNLDFRLNETIQSFD